MKNFFNYVFFAVCFGAFCIVLGYQQGIDAKWAASEAADAAYAKGKQDGYATGSNAGLVAAHRACESATTLKEYCDWLLAQASVAPADKVQFK